MVFRVDQTQIVKSYALDKAEGRIGKILDFFR